MRNTRLLACLASFMLPAVCHATEVATISGCYDCGVFDTPSLIFNNTTGGTLNNATMMLHGYNGLNNGLNQSVSLGSLGGGSTQFFWGSLPGSPSSTTPGNLTAYDYDDEYYGTSHIILDPTCGGGGCAPGGGDVWYADVGDFNVLFTATISGGTYDGQSVYALFSPSSNATGGFVGWEGLDPNGWSESPLYDVHTGVITGDLANIYLGAPPAQTPEPASIALGLTGLGLAAWARRRAARQG
ncbi:MAG: PEP-CTERM sorting domain-containing protein [Burkholderiaceae bacterium]|nr:PEP-CTERM sorting domain-containing protein [Roseateles sp.]MBV8471258.1 PEP-CTERM sorting domain-containing protein [Burkholderiaceae bacterium]